MLNIPDTGSGHVTQDLRFVAPEGDDGYTHTHDKKEEGKETSKGLMPKYLYTCLMDDIAFLKTEAYMGVSRRLNLEKSRTLEEGEVGVGFLEEEGEGEEKMVFDIVDAQFAVVERNALESPLLRLPRELRDLIWTFTFTGTAKPACKEVSRYSPFRVLTVCRQIYTEAISLAGPFLTWSFICLRDYESFFWDIIYSEGPKHKIRLVHSIQIGVDPSDLYMLAQIVDPGTDDDVDDETGEYRPTLRAFENLTHVELLLSATGFFADSDNEDDEEAEEVEPTRYESEYIEESRVNFTKTMERKLPSVRVTYKDFDDSSAMKRFWTTQDPKELILRTSSGR
ncbi:uncharacterized protein J4E84_010700 [Alternaria hordeiaustralica]|uniref:uncharacterized protein n=1 Tax=Alternaria hordeiaustralica TaxID=1187925 RepID=UPI0020C3440A|nr:uncharacterized protein J4E84_010700 [Alternaria hordeiaustralica]KAI4674194.1 hypothetical protein J4E84_010700 [Alternaria hordeiaustralica]